MAASGRTVVLGVGNLVMSDEGLGVRCVQRLQTSGALPDEVAIIDGGTSTSELLGELEDLDLLVIVDAVNGAGAPGSVVRLEGDRIPAAFSNKLSPHQHGINDLLATLQFLGRAPARVVVLATMAQFVMCPACQREYDDPRERRFHAQPNACPVCGPRLELWSASGAPLDGDPIAGAVGRIARGEIVAIKGLGGFHLACDATNDAAVAMLRARKHRDEKPFAVMVSDLAMASLLAELSREEAALLGSPERPIVLVPRNPDAPVAASIAPETDAIGLMLPYTPLHHLLLAAAGRPLVMTSANPSDEPICADNAVAWDLAAAPGDHGRYAYNIEHDEIDIRPLVREVVGDMLDGVVPAAISARFHDTLIDATVDRVRAAISAHGPLPVVLTGGAFHNRRLAQGIAAELADLEVYRHGEVPPGDGGIALGQAVIADALARHV